MRKIIITTENVTVAGVLNESATADEIWAQLPIQAEANTWGDEIYFEIPVTEEQAPDARADVDVGTLAYWPVGRAFCIFFGPTPASSGSRPRAYSPVNIVGHVDGDVTVLRSVHHGATVRIARARQSEG